MRRSCFESCLYCSILARAASEHRLRLRFCHDDHPVHGMDARNTVPGEARINESSCRIVSACRASTWIVTLLAVPPACSHSDARVESGSQQNSINNRLEAGWIAAAAAGAEDGGEELEAARCSATHWSRQRFEAPAHVWGPMCGGRLLPGTCLMARPVVSDKAGLNPGSRVPEEEGCCGVVVGLCGVVGG